MVSITWGKPDQTNRVRAAGQGSWDERRAGGDEPEAAGTVRAWRGLSGEERRSLLLCWLVAISIIAVVLVLNVLTRMHDLPVPPLQSIIDEGSSAVVNSVAILIPGLLVVWRRRRSPPAWRVALVFAAGALAYPLVHVSGFVALRGLAYPLALGYPYDFGHPLSEFLYEMAKDLAVYAGALVAFTLVFGRQQAADPSRPGTELFDIRDGARIVRAPVAEILAIRSAGNYVEFLLADGRRPLMRAPLTTLEVELAPRGFVRTHRSWLVNAARVRGLRPEGSGDYAVELGTLEAPLSRRFRTALETLRAA
ncbi:LytTR family DNA-binding domain-containing protein [Phenylobacterium sp. J367]|uniref:LytTR family DNA-binding domain-containing protein n=1 Tax=Phenylobacterium sp. J367 TaxID=2898435 RepID=UPI002151855D|nr:LytTR family DNA-binding domain-containing protein [Phenylobacterium sp. J367]MCR5879891.1 LytTR family DNA-binding domain-containing protein [Phenylobacterium sp. J367]